MKPNPLRRYYRHGTLTHLMVFDAIARLGSFTKAAEELHMAQPTVSVQMKKLSETIGLPLFDQVGRRIQLTPAGQELYAACQDIFLRISEVESRLATLRGGKPMGLRLAVSTTGKYFAPRLLGQFWERHPGADVSMQVLNREHLMSRLVADLDDFYVFSTPPDDPDYQCHRILPNPIKVYAREDHPWAGRKHITISELATQPMLVREAGSGTRDMVLAHFAAAGLAPTVRMELSSNEAIKQAIVGGLGISILSSHAMTTEVGNRRIVPLDVEGFPLLRDWWLVYSRKRQLSPLALSFLEFATALETQSRLAPEAATA